MFAQLLHAIITFCLATEKKKETREHYSSISLGGGGGKEKQKKPNRTDPSKLCHTFFMTFEA